MGCTASRTPPNVPPVGKELQRDLAQRYRLRLAGRMLTAANTDAELEERIAENELRLPAA